MEETIEKYKQSLSRLWKQSCENNNLSIIFSENCNEIKNKIVSLNIKDNYIKNLLDKTFGDKIRYIEWKDIYFHNASYYFNIDKKKLSISTLILDITIYPKYKIITDEKSLFSSVIKSVEKTINLNHNNKDELNKYLLENSNNIIDGFKRHTNDTDKFINLKIYFSLLTYNNLFIPITNTEYKELRDYELECRKKDDMEEVYRNLTLLSPSEYKEFIMWKESQRIYSENDSQKNLENAE